MCPDWTILSHETISVGTLLFGFDSLTVFHDFVSPTTLDTPCVFFPVQVAKWNVGKLFRDKSATMTGTMSIQGPKPEESPPIQLSWKVRYPSSTLQHGLVA